MSDAFSAHLPNWLDTLVWTRDSMCTMAYCICGNQPRNQFRSDSGRGGPPDTISIHILNWSWITADKLTCCVACASAATLLNRCPKWRAWNTKQHGLPSSKNGLGCSIILPACDIIAEMFLVECSGSSLKRWRVLERDTREVLHPMCVANEADSTFGTIVEFENVGRKLFKLNGRWQKYEITTEACPGLPRLCSPEYLCSPEFVWVLVQGQ